MLGFELLGDYSNIFHFTTTRMGGVSKGTYGSLNPSYYGEDKLANVNRNWEVIMNCLPVEPIYIARPYQVHGEEILTIDKAFLQLPDVLKDCVLRGVDALVTNEPKVLLSTFTADCVPSILYDPIKEVIAVVHSGWRGTVKKILAKTVLKLVEQFGVHPADLIATIGPSISLESFEVGDEVVEAFQKAGFPKEDIVWFNELTKKHHIDLWRANKLLLEEVGLLPQHIACSNKCTYINHEMFFSARRLGINSGRVLTAIMLK